MPNRPLATKLGLTAGLTGLLSVAALVIAPSGAVAQQYPPTTGPNPSGPPPPGCAVATAALGRSTIIAGGAAALSVTAAPNSIVDVFAYTRPSSTYRLVRSAEVGASGTVEFPAVTPPGNTRLYAQQRGCAIGRSTVLNVRTGLSLAVRRNGPRGYTFTGDSLPARSGGLIISLYRVTDDGRQVLTSQTRANATDGEWVINRQFTGTGRFGFVVRTGQDIKNAPGSSNVRPLLIF